MAYLGSVGGNGQGLVVGGGVTRWGYRTWFDDVEWRLADKLGLSAGDYLVASDDHFTAAGSLGWTSLTLSTGDVGGMVTGPTYPTVAQTAGNMSVGSKSYGFGFRARFNPTVNGEEGDLGVSSSDIANYVLALFLNTSGTKQIFMTADSGGAGQFRTAASSVTPDDNFHTVLGAFKYGVGGSTLSLSVDGEPWIDAATTKNPVGQRGMIVRSGGSSALTVDRSLFLVSN
jgi:hypothetical protein